MLLRRGVRSLIRLPHANPSMNSAEAALTWKEQFGVEKDWKVGGP
jgi:hypothetical protein